MDHWFVVRLGWSGPGADIPLHSSNVGILNFKNGVTVDSSIKYCSENLFLCEFILVLVIDAKILDLAKLLLLDRFHLKSVIFQLLSDLLAFLQVVKAVLLLNIRVLCNLGTNYVRVVPQHLLSLVLHVVLLLLVIFLPLNNAQEVVTFSLSLGGKGAFSLHELPFAGNLKLLSLSLQFFLLSNFLSAGLALTFLEGSLGTEGVDLRLTVGGFLLHFT